MASENHKIVATLDFTQKYEINKFISNIMRWHQNQQLDVVLNFGCKFSKEIIDQVSENKNNNLFTA